MSLPPVLERELRVAARKPGTYRLRLFMAAGLLLLWLLMMLATSNITTAQLGHHIYNALGIAALAGALFSGVFLTSDCISEEKREGTLGLLFLTDLKSYDVLMGKLAASSAQAIFGLLTVLPILGLPLLLGGVTGAEFARLILVLLATLVWSLTIGLAVSTFCHQARHAMGTTFLIILLLAGICPGLWWLQKFLLNSPAWDFLLFPSPCYTFLKSQENFYALRSGPAGFWFSITCVTGTGLICLFSSMIGLPKVWHRPETTNRIPWLPPFLWAKSSLRTPPRLLDSNPLHWLGTRDLRPGNIAARLLLALGALWLAGLIYSVTAAPQPPPPFIFAMFTLYALHLVTKILLTVESARRVNEDRNSGALELLLVTPLPIQEILKGQHTALQIQFRKALKILLLMNLVMISAVLFCHKKLSMDADDQAIFIELFAGGILALIVDFAALRWTGIWAGLTSRKHYRAVLATIGKVLFIPWICIFLLVFIRLNPRTAAEAGTILALWFIISIAVALWAQRTSKTKLITEFRKAAAER